MHVSHYVRFERVDAVDSTSSGMVAELHGELLRIDVVRPDVVRFKISRGGVFDEEPTFAVCADTTCSAPFTVETGENAAHLRTEQLAVTLWRDPFRIDVHRTDGSVVLQTARDQEGAYSAYANLNDAFTFSRACLPGDGFFGLGEKTGAHNRRGRDYTLWNTDVLSPTATGEFTKGRDTTDPRSDPTSPEFDPYYVSIPLLYHRDHVTGKISASFVDNGYRGYYDLTPAHTFQMHFSGGQYTEYVFAGPDMTQIIEAYTWLTGRTPLPPLWSLGYHQCRWHRYTQSDVEGIARRHREFDIPCDTLWLDIEHMDGYRVFTWDRDLFPDPEGMVKRLQDDGFGLITIVDPGIKHEPGNPVYDQARERDVLCRAEGGDHYIGQVWPGNTVFPDFVTEEGRAWWGQLNARHVESGVIGIWNDMNEPATGRIPPDGMRFGHGKYAHERYHNQYAMLMAMGTTAGLLDAMPDRRTFVLSRAGFAGIQRYAANWMGDNHSRWDHLAMSIPMAAGLGISGQTFVGADVGGFAGSTTAELFLRWVQYGALTPFFRNHSSINQVDQYAWSFGDAVLGHVRDAVKLRYRLLPYLYTAFVHATESGLPVQRPLVLEDQYDPLTVDIDDEYLLGPDLLVAPVLEPGQTSRTVYLPRGSWYGWHTDQLCTGGQQLIVATPLDRIPLYARAGTIVPMWPEAPDSTSGHAPATTELHLFVPPGDGSCESHLQEDDGLTFAALGGSRVRTHFLVTRVGSEVAVRASVEGSGYAGFARERFDLVIHGVDPSSAQLNGVDIEAVERRVVIPDSGQGFLLTFNC